MERKKNDMKDVTGTEKDSMTRSFSTYESLKRGERENQQQWESKRQK